MISCRNLEWRRSNLRHARPGGTATGVSFFLGELTSQRLELLRELVPAAARVAVLVKSSECNEDRIHNKGRGNAAHAMALQIKIFLASRGGEIHGAFESIARERPYTLLIGSDPFTAFGGFSLPRLRRGTGLPRHFRNARMSRLAA